MVKSCGLLVDCRYYYYNIIVIDTVTDETFVVGVIVTLPELINVHEAYTADETRNTGFDDRNVCNNIIL